MNNYYITFGSAEYFPYGRDEYVLVKADNEMLARKTYRKVHPDYHEGILNFSSIYNEEEWNEISDKYYKDIKPAEILVGVETS